MVAVMEKATGSIEINHIAILGQDTAAQVGSLVVKVLHVDAHAPKSWATEEHQNNQQVD